jgi:uncharacterized membrane protein
MNAAHLHLMFNHLPIIGLSFAILLNFLAVFGKSQDFKKLSSWFYILIGLLTFLATVTGDGAGEIIRTYPGISSDSIEYHETWGYIFLYGLLLNSAIAIGALWFSGKNPVLSKKLQLGMLFISFIVLILAYQAGTTGGKIRHPEIEHGVYKQ